MNELFPLMAACEGLLGEILVNLKDAHQALERFLRASALIDQHNLPKASFAPLYQHLSACYTRLGQPEKARAAQAEYDRLAPASDSN